MNEDSWNTGWDPYDALKTAEHNIHQLILAANNSTEVMKDLANKYNHQQEVIQQLMFQNRKLNNQLTTHTTQITRLLTEIEVIKQQIQK